MKTKLLSSAVILLITNSLIFTQEINGPTSWDVYDNVFSAPNVHIQLGRNKLDYYGSGDVNNDEVINSSDLDAMKNGVKNDRSDVDGDGTPSTSNDKAILQDYLNGGRNYLPGHWNSLKTKNERIDWLEKMVQIDDVYSHAKIGWKCRNFVKQWEIDFFGISNIDEYISWQNSIGEVEYDKTHNARFNIPLQYFSTKNTQGDAHAVGGVLVGDNPTNFDDWYFVRHDLPGYPQIHIGDFPMSDDDGYADMKKNAYVESSLTGNKYFTFNEDLLSFKVNNGSTSIKYLSGALLRENPNIVEVKVEKIDDSNINYTQNINVSPDVTGSPNLIIKNSTLEQSYEPVKPSPRYNNSQKLFLSKNYTDGENYDENSQYPNIEYSFDRKWIGIAYSGGITKKDSTTQKIIVRDIEPPSFTLPSTVTIFKEDTLSSEKTGIPTNVKDNSNLEVAITYSYQLVAKNHREKDYEVTWRFTDKFGNDTTGIQKVTQDLVTGIGREASLPGEFKLWQNYPNPFNPTTTIVYTIPNLTHPQTPSQEGTFKTSPLERGTSQSDKPVRHLLGGGCVQCLTGDVLLKVYNVLGKEVAALVNERKLPRRYSVTFNAEHLPSGIYFYKLTSGTFTETKRMILLK